MAGGFPPVLASQKSTLYFQHSHAVQFEIYLAFFFFSVLQQQLFGWEIYELQKEQAHHVVISTP